MAKRSFLDSFITVGLTLSLGVAGGRAVAAQARTGTVRVEVVAGGAPIEGASVSAKGVSAKTNASGIGTLLLPAGKISVAATKSGYQITAARVEVVAGAETTVHLTMTPVTPPDRTVVASTRTGRHSDEQAVAVAGIDRDQIETKMLGSPGDLASLFSQGAGLALTTTSPVLGTTMARIQGLPGHYTALLSDGVHLYTDRPGGISLLQIPPMGVDRVEVIKGPASAIYGSDSLAGSINLLSRIPGTTPSHEFLFSQSSEGGTDGVLWLSSPAGGKWSHTLLAGGHYQDERDRNGDGWSDIPGYKRGVLSPQVFWDNGRGRTISGLADVRFEKREGGSAFARESLETKTANGRLSGQIVYKNGYILAGAASLFIQSRDHYFGDVLENERPQGATIEITLRRPSTRNVWMGGIVTDWYGLRTYTTPLPSGYISTRPGIFFGDDWKAASALVLSGSARLDHHNLYGFLLSPRGSALVRRGAWAARVSGSQGYFTPRPIMEETEAAGLTRLTIEDPLKLETARSVSADFSHTTRATTVTVTLFRTQIDNPGQIDRTTYTLRTETQPIGAHGVEILGTARRAPLSLTGMYAYTHTRELDGRALPLTPQHRAGLMAALEGRRGRIGADVLFTGQQRLDANPYRSTSESYVVTSLVGEARFGRWRLFVNADNVTDVRQTKWDPIGRPTQDVDGRWTVDAWAPLEGRIINAGIRIAF
jgi:iron complex outermembrane receptor protein